MEHPENIRRCVLGTAQLGMQYGVANLAGQPSLTEACSILNVAVERGVPLIDTAQAYGDSEKIIGVCVPPSSSVGVMTKLSDTVDVSDGTAIRQSVEASVARVRQPLWGIMLHSIEHISAWNEGLLEALLSCQSEGLVRNFGISVYRPQEFDHVLQLEGLGFIQAPLNAFDRALVGSRLRAAEARGVRVFIRSVFLQGLLLRDPGSLAEDMAFASPYLRRWRNLCERHNLAPHEGALMFALYAAPNGHLVIGCERVDQLQENLDILTGMTPDEAFIGEVMELDSASRMIDPRLWSPRPIDPPNGSASLPGREDGHASRRKAGRYEG